MQINNFIIFLDELYHKRGENMKVKTKINFIRSLCILICILVFLVFIIFTGLRAKIILLIVQSFLTNLYTLKVIENQNKILELKREIKKDK